VAGAGRILIQVKVRNDTLVVMSCTPPGSLTEINVQRLV
jgi:hypothetical protein